MRRTRRPGRPAIPRGGGRSLAPVAAILTGLLLWSIVDGAAASGGSARRDGSSRPGRPHAATGQVTAHDGAFWLGSTTISLRGVLIPVEGNNARFTYLQSWGMNLARLPVEWSKLEPTAPIKQPDGTWTHAYDPSYLAKVQTVIGLAQRLGVYVVVGNYWDFGTYFGWPDWLYQAAYNTHGITYEKTPDGKTQAETDFWSDALRQQFMTSMLTYLAGQLAATPGIVGYDVLNEPARGTLAETHDTTQLILDWQLTTATAIRAVDPPRVLFFTTRGYLGVGLPNADLSGWAALGNVAFDLHDYYGARWGDGLFNQTGSPLYRETGQSILAVLSQVPSDVSPYIGTVASQKRLIQTMQAALAPAGIPLIVGEFGDSALQNDPGVYRFYGTTTTAFNLLGVSWAANFLTIVIGNDGSRQEPWASIVIAAAQQHG